MVNERKFSSLHFAARILIHRFNQLAERPPQEIIEHREDGNFRRRTHFTVFQRGELEKVFNQSQYISPRKRQSLSQELGIPKEVVLV